MFGRRRRPPAAADEYGNAVAIRGVVGQPVYAPGNPGGTTGWAPFGHGQHASDQIGAYSSPPLSSLPGIVPGLQLFSGVCALRSGWYFPSVSAIPNEQQTNQAAQLAGGQRRGSIYGGAIGPVSVRKFRTRVTQASIAQTALMAQPWAGVLAPSEE